MQKGEAKKKKDRELWLNALQLKKHRGVIQLILITVFMFCNENDVLVFITWQVLTRESIVETIWFHPSILVNWCVVEILTFCYSFRFYSKICSAIKLCCLDYFQMVEISLIREGAVQWPENKYFWLQFPQSDFVYNRTTFFGLVSDLYVPSVLTVG